MPELRRVPAGPFEIAYVEAGDGEPLVLCHGNEADHRQYDHLLPLLGPGIRALSYDQRDTGGTTGGTGDYTMADLGRDCIAFLDALGLPSAHVLGTSFGGMVAMHAAIAAPERVRSLVLVSTTPARDLLSEEVRGLAERSPEERRAFMADAILTPQAGPEQRAEVAALLTGRSPEQSARRFAAMAGHDCRDQLPTITAPTLVLHGSADPVIPAASGARIAELVPGATLHVLDGLRHGLTVEGRDQLVPLVRQFVLRAGADRDAPRPGLHPDLG